MPRSPYVVVGPGIDRPLRQCELLTNVVRIRVVPDTLGRGVEGPAFRSFTTALVLVVSQDCDLEQDHHVRYESPKAASDKLLPEVLLLEVSTAEEVFARIANSRKKEWDRLHIEKNKNERFHFLQKIDPGCDRLYEGLPELVIDFKRFFTVATDELYRRIEIGEASRRCVLSSPYLEHLSGRFATYLSRVALPSDHLSD